MIKAKRREALALTQEIIRDYWQGGSELLKAHLSEDIVWIGSMDSEYLHGKETVLARFAENQQAMPPVYLDQEEYELLDSDRLTCAVVGRYRAFTDPNSELLLSEKQRVTFLWRNAGGHLEIYHLHLSNILHIQDEDERFPHQAGKINHDYLQMLLREHSRDSAITLTGVGCVTYRVNYSDILFVRASRNYTVVTRRAPAEPIRMRQSFSAFSDELPSTFYQLSRSITVNLRQVDRLCGTTLFMSDGTELSVPTAKRSALQARLEQPDVLARSKEE